MLRLTKDQDHVYFLVYIVLGIKIPFFLFKHQRKIAQVDDDKLIDIII